MNDKTIVTKLENLEGRHTQGAGSFEYTKYQVTRRKDFDQCYVSFYEVPPGKSAYPKHFHNYNSECFYIISGEGMLETEDGFVQVSAGDIMVFPCGKAGTHKLTNTSETENLLYLDFDTTNSPDIIEYPDSGKIGMIEFGKKEAFFRGDSNVDYYDGEK